MLSLKFGVIYTECQVTYFRLESRTALAASEAKSRTPTTGLVTVPTAPFTTPTNTP